MVKAKEKLPMIKIKQTGSPRRRPKVQELHLRGLGLRRMNQIVEVEANPVVLGLIRKAQHMITIISE